MTQFTYNVQRTFINFEDDEDSQDSPCACRKRSNTWDGLISCGPGAEHEHEETTSQSTICAADEVCSNSAYDSSTNTSESDSDCPRFSHSHELQTSARPATFTSQADGFLHDQHQIASVDQCSTADLASPQHNSQMIYCILPPITVRLSPEGVPMWDNATSEQLQCLTDKNVVFTQCSGSTVLGGNSFSAGLEDTRTTCMLRNLPNDYTRDMLVDLLNGQGFRGLYDFIYLPVDFKRWVGLGYAFVNFTAPVHAQRARVNLNGFKNWLVKSVKVCDVCWGEPLQGLAPHIERYRNSPVMHELVPDHVKPALFMNGERVEFPSPTRRLRHPRDSRLGK